MGAVDELEVAPKDDFQGEAAVCSFEAEANDAVLKLNKKRDTAIEQRDRAIADLEQIEEDLAENDLKKRVRGGRCKVISRP